MSAACQPFSIAAAAAATTVLPLPTSPCSSRASGAAGEVRLRLRQGARLRPGECERQRLKEARGELRRVGEHESRVGGEGALAQLQRQVMREELLEGESLLRRVAPGGEFLEPGLARRPVQIVERLEQGREPGRQSRGGRQEIPQRRALGLAQRLGDQRTQTTLRHALGERVDRRQRIFKGCGLVAEPAVLRMHDLEAEGSAAHFPEAAQARAAGEIVLLAGGEIEESQRQHPRAVGMRHRSWRRPR